MSDRHSAVARLSTAAGDATGLRLALFSGNYNYTRDGANQALNRLARFLLEEGAEVRVYSPTTDTPAFPPAGDLVSVPSFSIPGRSEYRLALGLPRAIRRDIARFAPTAIHLSAPDLLNLRARNLGRRAGLPVVASLHTRFETYLAYYGFGWVRPAMEAYLRRFYGGCDQVLAPNAPMAEWLASHGLGAKAALWRRGVDRVQFSPARRDLVWRREQGIADHEVAVVFLGRLVLEKGVAIFADTLAALQARNLPARALVIGDGPSRRAFAERLPSAVFTGMLTGDDLGRALASGDILFNPSRTETFSNATLEGMSAGLAVVCPRAPNSIELITPGIDGLVVEDFETQAFADAIQALVVDEVGRARLGAAARRRSAAYDWTDVCRAVLETYRRLGAVPEEQRAHG